MKRAIFERLPAARGVAAVSIAVLAAAAMPARAETAGEGDYVGSAVCLECHQNVHETFQDTIHSKVFREGNARSARMLKGCEACHGPGGAHVANGGGPVEAEGWVAFDGKRPDVENASCLGCHEGGQLLYWAGGPHQLRGNVCTDCHYTHENRSREHLLRRPTETATCAGCHLVPRSQTWRNSHHPQREGPARGITDVGREGWMSCSACHNPHGTVTDKLVSATSVNDKCFQCHADKRGPFLWEHPPVQEDCLSCHDPHGSIHPAMLNVAQPRLCQSCHDPTLHPSEARQPQSRFVIQKSCQNCHQQVHGSNHPSGMFFTR